MSHVPVVAPVQQCQGVWTPVHWALFGSQMPVPLPVQHLNGSGVGGPEVHALLCGQLKAAGSPSKQPVFEPVPLAFTSRQKPQKTLFWPMQVPALGPVQQLKGCAEAAHCASAL